MDEKKSSKNKNVAQVFRVRYKSYLVVVERRIQMIIELEFSEISCITAFLKLILHEDNLGGKRLVFKKNTKCLPF